MIKEPTLLKIDLLEYQDNFGLRYPKKDGQKIRTKSSFNRSRDHKESNGSLGTSQWLGGVLPKKQR